MSTTDLERILELLPEHAFGRPLTILDVTTSTNDAARELAEFGAVHGCTVVADRQTAGRGSQGRVWYSPPGVNLYVSMVLRPRLAPARLPLLSLALGLAVCDCVRGVSDLAALVKWPNDVWIGRRKVAGILVEASSIASADEPARFAIAGIGLDVNLDVPADLSGVATSMAHAAGRSFDRADVLASLLAWVQRWLEDLESGSDIPAALADRLALVGEPAFVDDQPCVVEGVDPDGSLRVRTERGTVRYASGQLRPR
ncbi:MAG: biotin--[acetyl-CoA-carboxylase] ligase [Deltaproteobacteria bacterium]|nr:biotin--[acetyl-CoA-carboxylase] ligase [Deltaproteobacteria bacterium]